MPRTVSVTLEELTDPTDRTLLRAAGIALGAMRATKSATLEDALADTGPLTLTPEQSVTLARCEQPLAGLRLPTPDSDISTTIVVCPSCGEYAYVSTGGSAPTKCALTLGCDGTPRKPKPARRVRATVGAKPAAPHTNEVTPTRSRDTETT